MSRLVVGLLAVLALFPMAKAGAQAQPDSVAPVNWPQELTDGGDGPSTLSRVTSGLGTALLGAGLGFFASQIVQGDWQDDGSSDPINRSRWAFVGAGVGFTLGVRFPLLTGGRGALGRPGMPRGRDHLGADELQGLGMDDAYDAVSALRPEWLRIRGSRSLAASVDPVRVDGSGEGLSASGSTPLISEAGTIQVYVDGVRMGSIGALANISIQTIRDMYFFDAAAATIRWGEGNPHGAILVIT